LLDGRVLLRPDERGEFDELLLFDANGNCIVHMEMMDRNSLWIGFSPDPKQPMARVCAWIGSGKSKLTVHAVED